VDKKPTFFWQATLILLPLILLVAVGIYSLRQDKALAEAEAKERAQSYADDLERHISTVEAGRITNAFADVSMDNISAPMFLVSTNGALLYPPPDSVPVPVSSEPLTAEQQRLWTVATALESSSNRTIAVTAYRDFLKSDPPYHHDVRARYGLAMLLGDSVEAKDLLATVKKTKAISEAGLPMALLAKIRLTELAFNSTNLSRDEKMSAVIKLCEGAVENHTLLTEPILDMAHRLAPKVGNIEVMRRRLDNERMARELYDAAGKSLADVSHAIVVQVDEPYLLIPQRQQSQIRVACCPLFNIKQEVDGILSSAVSAPDYFGFTVDIAGREITSLNAKPWREESHFSPRGSPPGTVTKKEFLLATNAIAPVFATATGSGATETLKVNVVLTNRDALFKRQQARRNWFGTLILLSAVVAGSGLWRSWRTFTRQQQLNEMKSNFVSSVSHELRAPIASVRLLAEALDRGAVSDPLKQKEYFRFIVQECHRLTGLIGNVLDFSRIEQGRKQYHFEETDLNALVDQTVNLLKPMANERGVELERSNFNVQSRAGRSGSMFNVVCDGFALQQALVNLIDNAIKHSPSGGHVTIALETDSTINHQPSTLNLSVTDQGPGIPVEEHQKIFERFYRRGSELRRETQGIGIGLTIVKHVAEAHGGRVVVESAVGQGSKFTIELPQQK
jgi:signal transduction histidine kinase